MTGVGKRLRALTIDPIKCRWKSTDALARWRNGPVESGELPVHGAPADTMGSNRSTCAARGRRLSPEALTRGFLKGQTSISTWTVGRYVPTPPTGSCSDGEVEAPERPPVGTPPFVIRAAAATDPPVSRGRQAVSA
jgi:hypothetical protein